MAGIKLSDLSGGGAFRWILRVIVILSIGSVLVLRLAFHVNIFLAVLAGTSIFFLGVLITWALLVSGRIRVKY